MPDSTLEQSEQIVFFIDLLGSSAVVSGSDRENIELLTKMLVDVGSVKADFHITRVERNRYAFLKEDVVSVMPAISTFSDHVLMSFDVDEMSHQNVLKPFNEAFGVAQILIGRLALDALQIGFLIRGGATLNSLYHQNGAVIGKGLIEAYDLERKVAHYPRIAVSRKLYSKGAFEEILTDHDGVRHFDYLTEMLSLLGKPEQLNVAINLATENASNCEKVEEWNQMSKWIWLLKRLEEEKQSRTLRTKTGPPLAS